MQRRGQVVYGGRGPLLRRLLQQPQQAMLAAPGLVLYRLVLTGGHRPGHLDPLIVPQWPAGGRAGARPGRYGGSFENRTRFLREIVAGIQRDCPGLGIGVRLSAFDFPLFRAPAGEAGKPLLADDDANYGFGADPKHPLEIQLDETIQFLALAQSLGIELICVTAGSPYYNPHIQRPALFPPSDGYAPPEDPLVGVARQIGVVSQLKEKFPALAIVGSAYTYLQDWLPNVAQAVIRARRADFIGLGRMMLAYPEFPADVLTGRSLNRKRICRTFSDSTTAPRNGLVSGCYPLDPFYKARPEAQELKKFRLSGL